jgi:hypothetical protein
MRRERKYLCIGCKFAPNFTGGTSRVYCSLLGEEIAAVQHAVGVKYEDCSHRSEQSIPVNFETAGERLVREAREARSRGANQSQEPLKRGIEAETALGKAS